MRFLNTHSSLSCVLPTLNTYLFHSLLVDGTERQSIKDMDGNLLRPKISIFSYRQRGRLDWAIRSETELGKSRRKDMSPMGDKVRIHLDSHQSDGADYSFFLL